MVCNGINLPLYEVVLRWYFIIKRNSCNLKYRYPPCPHFLPKTTAT